MTDSGPIGPEGPFSIDDLNFPPGVAPDSRVLSEVWENDFEALLGTDQAIKAFLEARRRRSVLRHPSNPVGEFVVDDSIGPPDVPFGDSLTDPNPNTSQFDL